MKTKNIIIQATMALLIAFAVVSCNDDFFNQVPNDRITIEDVFNEKNYAERFLAGIYAYIQDESRVSYLTLDALSDDLDQSYDRPGESAYFMYPANLGNWNASSNYYNMWLDSYRGIRSATYFMQHIEANAEMVKNGEFSRIKQYKAEARALVGHLLVELSALVGRAKTVDAHMLSNWQHLEVRIEIVVLAHDSQSVYRSPVVAYHHTVREDNPRTLSTILILVAEGRVFLQLDAACRTDAASE